MLGQHPTSGGWISRHTLLAVGNAKIRTATGLVTPCLIPKSWVHRHPSAYAVEACDTWVLPICLPHFHRGTPTLPYIVVGKVRRRQSSLSRRIFRERYVERPKCRGVNILIFPSLVGVVCFCFLPRCLGLSRFTFCFVVLLTFCSLCS